MDGSDDGEDARKGVQGQHEQRAPQSARTSADQQKEQRNADSIQDEGRRTSSKHLHSAGIELE
jgi:hypothetical protein